MKNLINALKNLTEADLAIDEQGRIMIDNIDIINQIRQLTTLKPDIAEIDNVGCCTNLAKCGTSAKDMNIKNRFVGK